jgi:hypothetical protein
MVLHVVLPCGTVAYTFILFPPTTASGPGRHVGSAPGPYTRADMSRRQMLVQQVDSLLSAVDHSRHYFKESEGFF